MRRNLAYLEDIIAAAEAMAEFVRGRDLEYLLSNPMLQSAMDISSPQSARPLRG